MGVVSALYQADPSTARTVDELGNRPLHAACFSGAATPVIETLLSSYPMAVLSRNNQGSQPLDIVRRLRHDNKKRVTLLLEEKKKKLLASFMKNKNSHRRGLSLVSYCGIIDEKKEMNKRDGPPVMKINSYDNVLSFKNNCLLNMFY